MLLGKMLVLELKVGWKRHCEWQMLVAVVVHMTGGEVVDTEYENGVTCEE